MSSTPSAIISDAITSLTHATNLALSTVEDQARLDVARAVSETRQARNQRDEALNSLRAAELGQATHKQQLEGWKTAVEKGDLTINHQTETISQLRLETSQWKEQYAQLEKTCQQWKDQFLRVEQERYRLSARLEELVADQLSHANHSTQQFHQSQRTKPEHELAPLSTASSSTKRGSTTSEHQTSAKRKTIDDDLQEPPLTKSVKPTRAANLPKTKNATSASAPTKPTKKPAGARSAHEKVSTKQQKQAASVAIREHAQESASTSGSHRPQTQVVRRVQAVIEVPVKTEEEEDTPQYNEYEPEQEEPRPVKKPRTSKPIAALKKKPAAVGRVKEMDREKSKSWQVWRDEEYRTPHDGHAEDDDELEDFEEDEDDDEDADFYRPVQRRRNPQRKKSAKDLREAWEEQHESDDDEDDEEEDELIMGAEDNQEVYGIRAFPPEKLKSKSAKPSVPHAATAQKQSISKKRKIAPGPANGGGGAKPTVKVTRKK